MIGSSRAWSLIALKAEKRQYGGNTGYDDELTSTYRYDAAVPNHKQLAIGDLVLIRDADHLVGLAQIENITSSTIQKIRQRCPECGQVAIKLRKTKTPPWRCSSGHEFKMPMSETISLIGFEAHYGESFVPTPEAIPVADIKAAALRPSDQLSMEELDLAKLEQGLTVNFPETRALIMRFLDGVTLSPMDATGGPKISLENTGSPFVPSLCDTRESALRSIKLRRGQKSFRDSLLKRYGGRCVATGCDLIDIVEAAHIDPYRDANDNHPENGLLLRADLHTLFDLNLMAIEPNTLVLRFHPKVLAAGYIALEGKSIFLDKHTQPSPAPIARRWAAFYKTMTDK
ncbi:hypothetical protein AWB69_00744 [Caballeronia udeis]|uniref:HNH nuclease domain-containing protein n=1 Tax=Caballeronia udeis TaxID=1232866 RepID=A0A158F741_9BURK|nr:HNH endonuclease [Caballeronia udeis]SAL15587.1 hypothetical protein AWB69_00744 [Caballeronia udeis]